MTTAYETASELELDFDDLLDDGILDKDDVARARESSDASRNPTGIALQSEAWSSTDAQALRVTFRRCLRTTGPFIGADALALATCGSIAQAMMSWLAPEAAAYVGLAAPLALLPMLVSYWISGLYSEIWVHPVIELRQLSYVTTMTMFAGAAVGLLIWPFPLWCAVAWVAALVLVPLFRVLVRRLLGNAGWWGFPTLIIATGDSVAAITSALLRAKYSGLRPVLLTDPKGKCRTSIMPVVNDPATLESMLRAQGIRHAVVSLPEFSNSRMSKMIDRYGDQIPHMLVWSDASTLPALWGASRNSGRLSGLEVRNSLLLATLQGAKRVLDVVIAWTALVMALPIMVFIAIVMKSTDAGPLFFGHTRIGRHGKPFKAWKFRTMQVNGDQILRDHLARNPAAKAEWERDHKLVNDPRVTRIGRFLRISSLDELPQIWNVLKGDMSLVGPRPIVTAEVHRYGDLFRLYTAVKPGITGLWQVSGRTGIGYEDRVRLDEFYIRHWSPWLDVYIIAKTFVALAKRDGAC
ncbi:MAG TPA: undecaprenyl-phosphate galactose phosphotransferase WbaP [Tepidisphaeraceae bacterium]|jgi:Undecaprenyl-phosphate galactose phosphotransferase WbaP|nr:undecaprenyl-phosphate galactose phosphotransferase WbaP [Tepidisphaeraceae bacterium]